MIDTHCHVDLYKNPLDILQNCERDGITVLAMTNLPSHFEMGYRHVLPFKKIRLALGLHPLYADQHIKEFPGFIKNLAKTSYIGEIGLDFSKEGYSTKDIQLDSFRRILREVTGKKKILSLHSRRAENEVFNSLTEYNISNAIFHWYSGPLSLIDKIVDAGYFFSINTAMLKSPSGIKIIERIPLTHILTETDGPFIEYNNRVTEPSDVKFVEIYLSEQRNISYNQVSQLVKDNFNRLLSTLK